MCPLQRRKLDAVYYYMRSLAASNPILTAKESLMSLFEETKRKVRRAGDVWAVLSRPQSAIASQSIGSSCLPRLNSWSRRRAPPRKARAGHQLSGRPEKTPPAWSCGFIPRIDALRRAKSLAETPSRTAGLEASAPAM